MDFVKNKKGKKQQQQNGRKWQANKVWNNNFNVMQTKQLYEM